ncbi:uncharacterized protein MELLADRAFT_109778 [Melampsora larici-populina 98AG31]|uniref:Uncharacterized protein n=1 Tax=Melampsora larici-populina (strain 98AG31 / pathotype 3-4-7) TaxID=747676 RepID=F4RXL8_MELLP|nr:uncharacterized protein MELLADRAFT_109778 [Melampsora larici-populina 98AG31]EGG02870.1 hypothetical protein MELLADRAFT_109778 [Melampsora larici-populina 98AG31]
MCTPPFGHAVQCTQRIQAALRDHQYDDFQVVQSMFRKLEKIYDIIEEVDFLEEDGSNWLMWVTTCGHVIEFIAGVEAYLEGCRPLIRTAVDLVIDRCALDFIRRSIPSELNHVICGVMKAHQAKFRLRRHLDPYGTGRLDR